MLVSVLMPTYNHEKYIRQALEGILIQRRNFDLEVLVGDDCSLDKTVDIVKEYHQHHPEIFKPILREENTGFKKNYVDLFFKCAGKYIAVLSGDDYWIDPYKLQKQVDFLEENPSYVLVGHNAIVIDHDNGSISPRLSNLSTSSFDCSTRDLMQGNPFSASQVLFRNHLIKEFPFVFFQSTGEDRRLYILLSQFGLCRFEIDVTGVYRIHRGSITTNRLVSYRSRLEMLEEYIQNAKNWNRYFDGKYSAEEDRTIDIYSRRILKLALYNYDLKTALKYSAFVKKNINDTAKERFAFGLLRFVDRVSHNQKLRIYTGE